MEKKKQKWSAHRSYNIAANQKFGSYKVIFWRLDIRWSDYTSLRGPDLEKKFE